MNASGIALRTETCRITLSHLLYPASAASMMVGCYLLSGSMQLHAGGWGRLLTLLAVVNLYELLLLGVGLWLIAGRGLGCDGRILLVIEAMFIADATFLGSEAAAIPGWGAVITAALLLLGLFKAAIALRVLRLRVRWPGLLAMAAALTALAVMPVWMAAYGRSGGVSPLNVYHWWWAVGALLVMHAMAARLRWRNAPETEDAAAAPVLDRASANLVKWSAVVAVYVSLAGHLWGLGWVHKVLFQWPYLSPVLLGLAAAWERLASVKAGRSRRVRRAQLTLPMLAVALALLPSQGLMHETLGWTTSPLRLTMLGAAAVYGVMLMRDQLLVFAACGAAMCGAALLGHSLEVIVQRLAVSANVIRWMLMTIVPQTIAAWGVAAVGLAFVLLGIGVAVSLRRGRGHAADDTVAAPEES